MQKNIRIVLPWACFVLIVWVCCFRGSDYIDWRWLVGAVGFSAVCYAMLYVKRHKMLGKIEEHRNQLKLQAEEAIAPELEIMKGNWLKKDMLKRRMIREYLEKNTDYYADVNGNDAIRKVQDWISSLESSIFLLFLPFWGIIFWGNRFYTICIITSLVVSNPNGYMWRNVRCGKCHSDMAAQFCVGSDSHWSCCIVSLWDS